jgi:hypothetical protein
LLIRGVMKDGLQDNPWLWGRPPARTWPHLASGMEGVLCHWGGHPMPFHINLRTPGPLWESLVWMTGGMGLIYAVRCFLDSFSSHRVARTLSLRNHGSTWRSGTSSCAGDSHTALQQEELSFVSCLLGLSPFWFPYLDPSTLNIPWEKRGNTNSFVRNFSVPCVLPMSKTYKPFSVSSLLILRRDLFSPQFKLPGADIIIRVSLVTEETDVQSRGRTLPITSLNRKTGHFFFYP